MCCYESKAVVLSKESLVDYIVDHLTRYSVSCVIQLKRKEVIIESIFKIWIAIFGSPKRFLVDNGGESNNSEFISFCEDFNINVKTTAAKSPWPNGLVERHNGVLGNTVRKMMNDKPNYSLETGVAWAITAKKKPNFPNIESNKLPAMEVVTCSKIVAKNLSAMHDARQAFIKSESDKKLRRALRHQIRASSEVKYVTGDKVYYKRQTDDYWKGPTTVYGQENYQFLIKHGSTYQRRCRCTSM